MIKCIEMSTCYVFVCQTKDKMSRVKSYDINYMILIVITRNELLVSNVFVEMPDTTRAGSYDAYVTRRDTVVLM